MTPPGVAAVQLAQAHRARALRRIEADLWWGIAQLLPRHRAADPTPRRAAHDEAQADLRRHDPGRTEAGSLAGAIDAPP